MNDKITPERKLKACTYVLNRLIEGQSPQYICTMLTSFLKTEINMSVDFPEIWKHKPNHGHRAWFSSDQNGRGQRILILRAAIEDIHRTFLL